MALSQETQANPSRAVIAVTGPEAREFLNGLVTNSILDPAQGLRFAALLTPQGKILHTMFVHPADTLPEGGVLLDVASDGADDLVRRLTMFRLRRKIGIAKRDDLGVVLGEGEGEGEGDPRHPDLPARSVAEGAERANWDAYEAARIAAGVPDQGRDYGAEEVFPHDVNLDLLHGVDMKKGCFVGQEVVSRMHRKGGVRKRICAIAFEGDAPEYGAQIKDESGADLGTVRSTLGQPHGGIGLALVRIDRLAEAAGAISAGDRAVRISPPRSP